MAHLKFDLQGVRFGRLVVGARVPSKNGWAVKCDCGGDKIVASHDLRRGRTTSCGCFQSEQTAAKHRTHGHTTHRTATPEYKSWCHMVERCHRPTCKAYKRYGARGIVVCQRWRDSFEAFLSDVGLAPAGRSVNGKRRAYTIDRIDNARGYEPGNCRWATDVEQARNRTSNRVITFGGRTMLASDWAKEIGLSPQAMSNRLQKMTVERALTQPPQRQRRSGRGATSAGLTTEATGRPAEMRDP